METLSVISMTDRNLIFPINVGRKETLSSPGLALACSIMSRSVPLPVSRSEVTVKVAGAMRDSRRSIRIGGEETRRLGNVDSMENW